MYDLIIVGGGPAGSSAGRRAGIKGLHTLLIEKEVFPRYKACGGALSERALSYLDFPLPQSVREREIFGVRFRFKDSVIEGFHESRIATMVTRSILDDYLLEKGREAGIEIKVGENVIDCKEQGEFVEIITNKDVYRSKFVIIGEGSQGKMKRKVRSIDTKYEYGVCIVADVEEDIEKIDQVMSNIMEIHFDVLNMGYGWIFPHKNYYSVGIGAFAYKIINPKRIMNEFLKTKGFNGTFRLRGHTIPAGGITRNVVSPRVVLVGDAAGFVDPFAGEGIAYAIRSGQIAVEVIAENIRDTNHGAQLGQYESICQREFADDFKYALLSVKMMHRFPNFFFKILTGNQEVFEKFIQIPNLTRHYRSYLEWLIPRLPQYLFSLFASR
ncbi:MAG: geranylgeranyl reductase family protein [Deltaproteobacteria bacterium]|nr:geranylgeranyl reductase family protein [Deltaproteobacteria bacterium]